MVRPPRKEKNNRMKGARARSSHLTTNRACSREKEGIGAKETIIVLPRIGAFHLRQDVKCGFPPICVCQDERAYANLRFPVRVRFGFPAYRNSPPTAFYRNPNCERLHARRISFDRFIIWGSSLSPTHTLYNRLCRE